MLTTETLYLFQDPNTCCTMFTRQRGYTTAETLPVKTGCTRATGGRFYWTGEILKWLYDIIIGSRNYIMETGKLIKCNKTLLLYF